MVNFPNGLYSAFFMYYDRVIDTLYYFSFKCQQYIFIKMLVSNFYYYTVYICLKLVSKLNLDFNIKGKNCTNLLKTIRWR